MMYFMDGPNLADLTVRFNGNLALGFFFKSYKSEAGPRIHTIPIKILFHLISNKLATFSLPRDKSFHRCGRKRVHSTDLYCVYKVNFMAASDCNYIIELI